MDKERKKLLSVKDVAEWFGLNPMTIYRKAKKGELPAIKFGKNWLFPEDALEEWIRKRCSPPSVIARSLSSEAIPCNPLIYGDRHVGPAPPDGGARPPRDDNNDLFNRFNREFAKLTPLLLVYVFGSVVSGDETPQSDFDIAYLDDGSVNPFDFESELENVARGFVKNSRRIDLVRLNDAPVSIRYKVIKTGNLLYARSDDARAVFEDEVVREYLDYEPVLNKFYREVA